MTTPPTTATPAARAESLAEAASAGADYLMTAALCVRYLRDGEELAARLGEVEARIRAALAAEEERQRRADDTIAALAFARDHLRAKVAELEERLARAEKDISR